MASDTIEIRAAVCRGFGEPLAIETLQLALPEGSEIRGPGPRELDLSFGHHLHGRRLGRRRRAAGRIRTRAGWDGHRSRPLRSAGRYPFEEPCPYWKPDWTRAVKEALDLDVAGGEQDNNLTLWQYLIDSGTMDVAQPDVCYVGGVDRFLRVARMARDAGMPVTPHAANLSLVTIFTLHLMGVLENAGPYVEFSIEGSDFYPWQYGIYDELPVARDGRVEIPGGPRMGDRDPPGMAGEVSPSGQRTLILYRQAPPGSASGPLRRNAGQPSFDPADSTASRTISWK